MRVVFVTNGILFHQSYFSSCINAIPGVRFLCIASLPHAGDSQKLRLENTDKYSFPVLDASKNECNWNLAREAIKEADICIIGAENHKIIEGIDRIYFRYSEHIFRSKFWILNPKTYLRFPKMLRVYYKESKKSWLLCASSHTKFDFNFYGLFKNKCLKFGYFPKANVGNDLSKKEFPSTRKDKIQILYAGRSIDLKHPEVAFYVLKKLRCLGLDCYLTFVSLPSKLRSNILKKNSYLIDSGFVTVIDELPSDKLMRLMASSHLFVFSSDNGEGFGATLYEAMSSKMAVIANKLAGSTNLLIRDGDNGFVYKTKSQLDAILLELSRSPSIMKRIAERAKEFIDNHYSGDVAAKNLIDFVKSGYTKQFQNGEPLSKL